MGRGKDQHAMNLDTALQSDTFPSQLPKTGNFSILCRTASSPFTSLEEEEFYLHSSYGNWIKLSVYQLFFALARSANWGKQSTCFPVGAEHSVSTKLLFTDLAFLSVAILHTEDKVEGKHVPLRVKFHNVSELMGEHVTGFQPGLQEAWLSRPRSFTVIVRYSTLLENGIAGSDFHLWASADLSDILGTGHWFPQRSGQRS